MKSKLKLKQSIYIMIFLCSFVPVCIWILFSMRNSRQRIESIITDNIQAIGGSQVMSIQNFCEGRKESMETLSRMALIKNAILSFEKEGHSEELDEFLAENEIQKTYMASISVVDVKFNVIGSSQKYEVSGLSNFQFSNTEYHSGNFFIGNVYERETDSGMKKIIPLFIGVYDNDNLIGYLIEEIDCQYFDRLRLQTDFLEDGTLYLLDGNMQMITAGTSTEKESLKTWITTEEERQDYNEAWESFDHEHFSEGVIRYEIRGQEYITYFSNVGYTDWSIRITENMNAQWKANASVYLFLLLEGLTVTAILFYVQMTLTKKLVAPFNRIVKIMKDIQEKHDYSLRTDVSGNDEVGVVAQGIDELLEYIEKEELEEKRRHREAEERARAKAEALQHKEFLSAAMLANMPSGYHRCLPDAEKGFPFLQLGSHFEEIVGWTAEEIRTELGNSYLNLIWPEDLEIARTYADMVSKVGYGNAYDTSVYRMKHKDGTYRWITDATMFVDLGEESFFQGVVADITPYVEGMEEAKQLAEASSHAKTDFLSQMSHDIRTPMNAIVGFTNLAKKAESYEEIQKEYIPKIETASHQLLMIINDVLEMSSIEKGKIVFHHTPNNIILLVEDIMEVMRMQAEDKGIDIISDIQIKDKYIYCDESRLDRVLMNLMSNGIKFTPPGGNITITIRQQESSKEGYVKYILKISDTGIGMAPEFLPYVFEPFERERTSTVSRVEGTGLGMAIVKNIIDTAGGSISVTSEPDKGTAFIIQQEFKLVEPEIIREMEGKAESKPKEKMSLERLKEYFTGRRILLVEDNEFNRAIAEVVLENAGFVVDSAEDGHIAVRMMKNATSEDYYDIVLMDIQMPIMNGYEATRAIRAMKGERSRVKIFAVTANAFESDKQNAKEAGMDGHISKPIDVDILYATLLDAINSENE